MLTRERKIIRQGGIAAIGHMAGSILTGLTALLLSRALEPSEFAIYALCISINGVLRIIGRCGINAGLLAQNCEPTKEEYETGLTVMVALSTVAATIGSFAMPWFARFSNVRDLVGPGIVTALLLPIHALPLTAITRMERQLRFRPMVIIELLTQVVGYAVGIFLAFKGAGVWGPIAGSALRAVLYAILPWMVVGGESIGFCWDRVIALRLIRFGVGYVVATASVQCRTLAFLSLTGKFIGTDATGILALSLRAVTLAAPVRAAAARVVLPSLAPIVNSPRILKRAIRIAVETEVLLSVPILALAVVALNFIVVHFSRNGWALTATLFPAIAAGAILSAAHAATLTALYVKGRFVEPVLSSLAHIAILTVVLAGCGSNFGIDACGIAAVLVWPAAWIVEWGGRRVLGTEWSRDGVIWALAGAASLLAWLYGTGLVVISFAIFVLTRRAIILRAGKIVSAFLPAK